MPVPVNGGFPELNTTRNRKSLPASPDLAPAKPARSRASATTPAADAVGAKPRRVAASATAARAVKSPARRPKADAVAAPAKAAKGVASKTGATLEATAALAKPVARKSSKPKVAAATIVAAVPVKSPRKSSKAKSSSPTVDVLVRDAVIARLDAMKANDLKVIDVRGKTSITDCLVIASGTSTRHVRSMGDEVIVTAKKFGLPPIGVEGEKDAEWMLVDLGDTVVHVMLPRARDFYGLERLWTLAGEARAASALSLASA